MERKIINVTVIYVCLSCPFHSPRDVTLAYGSLMAWLLIDWLQPFAGLAYSRVTVYR